MAKLERKNVKIFASNPNDATQVSAFLTGKNETPDYSSDPDVIQNTYYPKGWLGQGENDLPQVTDVNGVMYAESYKIAYLYQQGIADWIVTQEYAENSFCQVEGVLYKSLVDNNIGNDPTTDDGTNWLEIALEPYTGENIGTGEGVYKQKTIDNKLQFKTLAVTGNGNISSSGDVVTIAIGGGGTGDVYWGAIDGTLSNQSDLQQALNLKQNLIGYTPEDVSNKVTTVRTSSVATDTAYASEKATRTAIDNAITSANNYTDNALTNLSTDAFVLYANSWTDIDTGTLSTTAPTGTGTNYTLHSISPNTYENIANFTYTTTQETKLNNTFTYEVLVPIRNTTIRNWSFEFTLTITNQDVNNGLPMTIFEKSVDLITNSYNELNFQFKQDLININEIIYPVGSEISFKIKAMSIPESGELAPYNFDLLVYDQNNPIVISRNRGINKHYVTSYNTQTLGYDVDQEYFNSYMLEQLAPMTATSPLTISSNNISIGSASTSTSGALSSTDWNTFNGKQAAIQGVDFYYDTTIIKQEPDSNRTSYLGSNFHPYNYAYITQIGDSTNTSTNIYTTNINATNTTTSSISHPTSGVIELKNSLKPTVNGITLGNAIDRFTNAFVDDIQTNTLSTTLSATHITLDDDLLPNTNESLGSSSKPFYEVYASTLLSTDVKITNIKNRLANGAYLTYDFNDISPSTSDTFWLGYNNPYHQIECFNFHQASDIRNKENIKNYEDSVLDKLKILTPITYNTKSDIDKKKKLGLSAQELREIEPLCVSGIKDGKKDGEETNLGIDLYSLCTLSIKAIKELNEKIEALETRVKELEGKKELEK